MGNKMEQRLVGEKCRLSSAVCRRYDNRAQGMDYAIGSIKRTQRKSEGRAVSVLTTQHFRASNIQRSNECHPIKIRN